MIKSKQMKDRKLLNMRPKQMSFFLNVLPAFFLFPFTSFDWINKNVITSSERSESASASGDVDTSEFKSKKKKISKK